MRPGTLSLPTKRHCGPTFFHLLIVNTNSNSYATRSKDLEPCDCYNNIKLIIAILLRQQSGHVVGYPWLQGFDDGLAGDAGKCTWQCVTCLDMGVQLHLNEGGIVYCAHILSNTPSPPPPSPTAAAVGPQHMWAALGGEGVPLTNTNNTNHHLSYFQSLFIFELAS